MLSAAILFGLMAIQSGQKAPDPAGEIAALAREFDGQIGVYARNLHTGVEIAVNPDARFPAASTIKTAVMLEAYHQAGEGKLSFDEVIPLEATMKAAGSGVLNALGTGLPLRIGDLIHLMIVLSDNTATNMLIARLGTKRIDDRLLGYGLKATKIFRPTFRDGQADLLPELEKEFGFGMTTPREMATLMALIAEGRAISLQASGDMFGILARQQDRSMIPRLLPGDRVIVGNKTGTDSEKLPDDRGRRGAIRADAGIVTGQGTNYVIAIYTRRGGDTSGGIENTGVKLGARISRIVYDHFCPPATERCR